MDNICVFKIRFQGSVEKTDPFLYSLKYSPGVLKKKKKVLDVFNTDKKCFMKIKIKQGQKVVHKNVS